uniref:ARAD1C36674p n=1 Tax=Blastobotrys adeninivorans TaxID=409370 RepID=A0A060T2Y8_BLAAD
MQANQLPGAGLHGVPTVTPGGPQNTKPPLYEGGWCGRIQNGPFPFYQIINFDGSIAGLRPPFHQQQLDATPSYLPASSATNTSRYPAVYSDLPSPGLPYTMSTAVEHRVRPQQLGVTLNPQHSHAPRSRPAHNGRLLGSPEVIVISDSEDEPQHDDDEDPECRRHDSSATLSTASSKKRAFLHDSTPLSQASSHSPPLGNKRRKNLSTVSTVTHPSLPGPSAVPKPIVKPRDVVVPIIPDAIRVPVSEHDDDDGHYKVAANTEFAHRFHISRILGQGTFGKVVAAYDRQSRSYCAIKIIRSVQKYRDASRIELRVLATLAKYDRANSHRCIHLRECFDYRNHICIVTDLLGMSIYDFMKSNNFVPFPGAHIQSFARQLLTSVAFLHDLGLVHTDLKPENILLSDSTSDPRPYPGRPISAVNTPSNKKTAPKVRNVLRDTHIHLIDFGSAIFDDEYHSSVVSTRHYRAPEIILATGWSFPCDMWSIGCILVELCTGQALFQTHDNLEHLALMEKILDKPIDRDYALRAAANSTGSKYLSPRDGQVLYPSPETRPSSNKYVKSVKTLSQLVKQVPNYRRNKLFWDDFQDLLSGMFEYDPRRRTTAKDALRHRWFLDTISD